jgi:hypothetical protein
MGHKPSSLVWVRLNSVPVIAATKRTVTRKFVAHLIGLDCKLKSLDHLEPNIIANLNAYLAKLSNDALERTFLEFLRHR